MYSLVSLTIKLVLVLLFVEIISVSTAPKNIVEFKDVPFSWCDEDYPITDLIDIYNADDADAVAANNNDDDDEDIAFEEISYWNQTHFRFNVKSASAKFAVLFA